MRDIRPTSKQKLTIYSAIAAAAAVTVCFLRWGWTVEAARNALFFLLLAQISFSDIKSGEVSNVYLVAAAVLWAFTVRWVDRYSIRMIDGVLGVVVFIFLVAIPVFIYEKHTATFAMGGADIKLYLVCGLYLGLYRSILCLVVSTAAGLVWALFLSREREKSVSFTPFISISCVLCMFFGHFVFPLFGVSILK